MKSLAMAGLALAALAAAGPWHQRAAADTFGGRGPGVESEPNDRLSWANALGAMPAHAPLEIWGEMSHQKDRDVYRFDVLAPTSLDLRIITGAVLMPHSGTAGAGTTMSDWFLPILSLYGPDGALIFVQPSSAPNLLMLDVPFPIPAPFYAQITAYPGAFGSYGLQVAVHGD